MDGPLKKQTDIFDLSDYLEQKRRMIDDGLRAIIDEKNFQSRLTDAMTYSLTTRGKRIRPILCMAAAEAVDWPDIRLLMPAACAIEAIHAYSLIHDDLPAMDNDVLRRGKPTCHVRFDEATAILAGDALLTLAFEILSDKDVMNVIPLENRLRVIYEISSAAGYKGMVSGQQLDVSNEGEKFTLEELTVMHGRKTGSLIEASVVCGGLLGGGGDGQIAALEQYGRCIGLAFQVMDDILNVEGDPEIMGKSVGTDISKNKNTFPSLMGLQASKHYAKELVQSALSAVAGFDANALPLREIAKYVIQRQK